MNQMQREQPPNCFAQQWDKNEAACAGGADPDFLHPTTGLHVRDQCNFFQACGTRTTAMRNAQNFIPVQQLVRPPLVTPPPQALVHTSPSNFGQYLQQQSENYAERMRREQAQRQQQPQYLQQPPQAYLPQNGYAAHPAPTYQLNYMMPGYLTTPEIRQPGESMWSVLFREIARSVLKSMGHSVAHFFDSRPMGPTP